MRGQQRPAATRCLPCLETQGMFHDAEGGSSMQPHLLGVRQGVLEVV